MHVLASCKKEKKCVYGVCGGLLKKSLCSNEINFEGLL